MSAPQPYVGVTGFVSIDDVSVARDCASILAENAPSHRLMAGVLVSTKTLRGEPTESRRYPTLDDAERILAAIADSGAWPVVHYNTRATGLDLAMELTRLRAVLPSMRGLQLNVAGPDPRAIDMFLRSGDEIEFIVQVNRYAYTGLVPNAAEAFAYVAEYAHVASYALLDLSGGEGRPLDPAFIGATLALWDASWCVNPAIAGGLGPDARAMLHAAMRAVGQLVFRRLSFDAEGALRVPVENPTEGAKHQDRLDRDKALAYVRAVCATLEEWR